MTALGDWLRQIVMTVFLAVLADFILPTKSMQKYVRMVMGIAVIAVMIQPVLPVISKDLPDRLAEQASQTIFGSANRASNSSTNGANNLHSFQSELQQQTETDAASYVVKDVKQQVANRFHCTVQQVQVSHLNTTAERVSLTVRQTDDVHLAADVQSFVAQLLDLPNAQVEVRVERGESIGS